MRIVMLGSGNVATQLGKAFHTSGHQIVQVYSRNLANAQALATVLQTQGTDQLVDLVTDADFYIIAVADQAIATVTADLPLSVQGIVVHCSGATDMNVLGQYTRYGVIYPVQSIRKETEVALEHIPFGIEGDQASTTKALLQLMQSLSTQSFLCDSKQRLALHIAAVFANNFSNALFQIAYDILKGQELPFDLLKPIILETAQKVQLQLPKAVQTGPAKRKDQKTIQRHLQFLAKEPNWLKIYQQLTEEITKNDK